MEGEGHNSRAGMEELDGFIQRIERLTDEKKLAAREYSDAIKGVWAEAKGRGYDVKAMKEVIRLRGLKQEQREVVGFYVDVMDVFS